MVHPVCSVHCTSFLAFFLFCTTNSYSVQFELLSDNMVKWMKVELYPVLHEMIVLGSGYLVKTKIMDMEYFSTLFKIQKKE